MNQLKDAVAKAFDNIVASGAIEAAIEAKLAETITRAVTEQFTSYGEFGTAIKAKVAQAMQFDVETLDLASYSHLVTKIIRSKVDATMNGQLAATLEKEIGELLTPAPAEITLEALLEQYVQSKLNRGWNEPYGQSFTLVIDHSEGSTRGYKNIYIDMEAGTSKHSCEINIALNKEGRMYSLSLAGKDLKDKLFFGKLYGFEKSLFQMYTAGTKLIVADDAHADDFATRFPYPGDDD